MKTINQICNECNMSRSGLNKRINKIKGFREKYMKKSKGIWLINDNAVNIINSKKYSCRPKHYKHSIDHPRTRYDMEHDLEHMNKRLDKVIDVLESQQKTIANQQDVIRYKLS